MNETKKTLMLAIGTVAVLLPVILLTGSGCNHEPVGEDCEGPLSTYTMRYEWNEAIMISYYCQDNASEDEQRCLDQELQPAEDCVEQFQLEQKRCLYWYARKANKIPLRECGAEIFTIIGLPDDLGPDVHPISANLDVDTDGDGISNYWEFVMGYNPCTSNSFGCGFPADGTDDFDADGYIDSEDEYPICNGSFIGDPDALPDRADYPLDCV